MKNRGVIISIVLIIVCGVLITSGTRHFVTDGKAQATTEEKAYMGSMFSNAQTAAGTPPSTPFAGAEPGAGSADKSAPVPAEAEAGQSGLSAAEDYEGELKDELTAAKSDEAVMPFAGEPLDAVPEMAKETAAGLAETAAAQDTDTAAAGKTEQAAPSAVISPLTGSAPSTDSFSLSAGDYERRFNEADSRIAKMKESGVIPSTDTCRNMAEYEYRIWDSELNIIYKDIIRWMSEEEAEQLRKEEREWLQLRDETARKAASKYTGGSIESMEYTASLAVSTRARAYQLLQDYGEYLPAATLTESVEGSGLH